MNTTDTAVVSANANVDTTPKGIPSTAKAPKPDFGNGRYSALMAEAYSDAARLTSLSVEKREEFARQLGSDWGRAMSNAPATVKYGSTSKDGKLTLGEAAKVKGVVETKAITLARLLARANELTALAAKSGTEIAIEFPIDDWK